MASGPQVQANLMEAGRLVREAVERGAELVVLPEVFGIMGHQDSDAVKVAEVFGQGPMQDCISRLARSLNVWIVAGTIPMQSEQDGKYLARSLVYDGHGEPIARYDKIHLFDVKVEEENHVYTESRTVVHGRRPVVVQPGWQAGAERLL
ncbi:MAG: nitrilase-related carbon-nitrogen hydrolase [Thiolinea sp.]